MKFIKMRQIGRPYPLYIHDCSSFLWSICVHVVYGQCTSRQHRHTLLIYAANVQKWTFIESPIMVLHLNNVYMCSIPVPYVHIIFIS